MAICIGSQASGTETVTLGRAREDRLQMKDGARVYLEAVEGMKRVGEHLLRSQGMAWQDLDWIIPHQANGRILKRFCWLVDIPQEKAFSNLEHVGNTSSASIPVAMQEALQHKLEPGQKVLLLAIGAGFTAGAALVQITPEMLRASCLLACNKV
ncbi:MAG: hypothetical protein H6727_02510 [Myxococcales bacterium]|nr:hypothetical protein [Myxococcales bacterium]